MAIKKPARIRHNKPSNNKYVYMGPSGIHDKGLFARADIAQGAELVEYDGPRLPREDGERLAAEGNAYIFAFNSKLCIDGSVAWNLGRYANHSCSPNCKSIKVNGRILLRALRDIKKGEEITYDYGYDFKNYTENPCKCGAPNCLGYIVPSRYEGSIRKDI